jgi:hypothetical protein
MTKLKKRNPHEVVKQKKSLYTGLNLTQKYEKQNQFQIPKQN